MQLGPDNYSVDLGHIIRLTGHMALAEKPSNFHR